MLADVSHLIDDNRPGLHYGVAVAERAQRRGDAVVVAGFGFPNRLLAWRDGHLVDVADPVFADPERRGIGVAAADVDGDGEEEVYVLNTDTFAGAKRVGDRLFDDAGAWRDLFEVRANAEWANLIAGRSVAALDRRGTGRYGFVVANYGGPFALYELTGEHLRDVAEEAGLALVAGGRGLVVAPLVGSSRERGLLDVFAVNEGSPNFLFANQGDGTFVDVATEYGVADPLGHGRGVVAFDANDDGVLDLAWGNWEGPHRMCLQSGLGFFADVAPGSFAQPSRVRTLVAADLDNDGHVELFVHNIGEPNRLFARREGRWVEVPAGDAADPVGLGTGAAVADLDGDGCLELILSRGEAAPQPLGLYKCPDARRHHWLRVRPRTVAGAPARGATVTVHAGGRSHVRVIDAGSGYLCQGEPVAHVGLGAGSVHVDAVEVRWPGGATTEVPSPGIDRLIEVAHPGRG